MRNAIVDQILMERMNRRGGYDGRDYARGDYGRGGYDGRRGRDYGRDYARGGRELCMTVNMLYSDYCEVNKPYVSPERECHYYVELAKAFLEDDDGPEPSEKLALYYYCIAEDE
jgi:hypothetical protein